MGIGAAHFRTYASLAATLLFLGGCSDTERSWAYKYRFTFEDTTVTPRVSSYYRDKEECASRYQVALDRCVLQPLIPLWWIEWETSIELKAKASREPAQLERFSLITQTFSNCRKVRRGYLARLQKVMSADELAPVTISAGSCKPVYIGNRNDYTP